jgi:hypothetical protein
MVLVNIVIYFYCELIHDIRKYCDLAMTMAFNLRLSWVLNLKTGLTDDHPVQMILLSDIEIRTFT